MVVSQRLNVTRPLPFIFFSAATFESPGFQSLETYDAMNWRKFVLLGCVVACVFAASIATAQMRGHGNSMSQMGMRGALRHVRLPECRCTACQVRWDGCQCTALQ